MCCGPMTVDTRPWPPTTRSTSTRRRLRHCRGVDVQLAVGEHAHAIDLLQALAMELGFLLWGVGVKVLMGRDARGQRFRRRESAVSGLTRRRPRAARYSRVGLRCRSKV